MYLLPRLLRTPLVHQFIRLSGGQPYDDEHRNVQSRTYKCPGAAVQDIYADLDLLTFLEAVLHILMGSEKTDVSLITEEALHQGDPC